MISANRKLLEDLLYRVRSIELTMQPTTPDRVARREPVDARRAAGTRVADPSTTSVIVPAFNEADAIGERRGARSAAVGAVARDHRRRRRIGRRHRRPSAAAAGAIVVRHPYNKGNGAAVKSGIRRATGEHVLIIDGDGQHRPERRRASRRPARRVRPRRRRALGGDAGDQRAAPRQRARSTGSPAI